MAVQKRSDNDRSVSSKDGSTTKPRRRRAKRPSSTPRRAAAPGGKSPTSNKTATVGTNRAPAKATKQQHSKTRSLGSLLRVSGSVTVNPRGFGFLTGSNEDAFINPTLLEGSSLIDGDLMVADVRTYEEKSSVVSIGTTSHTRTHLFGVALRQNNIWYLRPDPWVSSRNWVLRNGSISLRVGDAISAVIKDDYVTAEHNYGPANSIAALQERALSRARVHDDEVTTFLKKNVAVHSRHAKRKDLTNLFTFTIDGPDSQDLDDALSVSARSDGVVTLYVHIADVADKVHLNSAIDKRAKTLGTSVYLPGRVVTMLSKELSFDECSLLEDVTRDTITVEMNVTPSGDISDVKIYESVIRSNKRLTYEEVAGILSRAIDKDSEVEETIELSHIVATRLGARRSARGGLSARRIEPRRIGVSADVLHMGESDNAEVAHDLIEEAMVAANESVAQWLLGRGLEGVYRVHAAPGEEAALALVDFASNIGVRALLGGELTPMSLASLERQLRERGLSDSGIWDSLIGLLGRAEYVPLPGEHFGLASNAYLHFTSPIRRYADLSVHRIVKASLKGKRMQETHLSALCVALNEATSRAAKAERIAVNLLSLKWLQSNVTKGSIVKAKVLRFSPRGALVQLHGFDIRDWVSAPGSGYIDISVDGLSLRRGGTLWHVGQDLDVAIGSVDLEGGGVELSIPNKKSTTHKTTGQGAKKN